MTRVITRVETIVSYMCLIGYTHFLLWYWHMVLHLMWKV